MNRKSFLKTGALLSSSILISPQLYSIQENSNFDLEEIREFVFAAHKDFDETKRIIETKPLLLNCTNQAKKGDFETAVGGASHMGRKDIADLLVSKGARLDIFNYTFLGYHDFVKKLIEDYPDLLWAPGPHGFTLLHHAKVGEHTEMQEWLTEKGLTETFIKGAFG
ncbi:MAG: ankyrin repeat domain-containing protein [bacterium]|nr:ankyrin repeat domain-containing protein [bacterium]